MLSFKLDKNFVDSYRDLPEPFGFNGLGAVTFYRTYSRIKDDGKQESWVDVCERVINGMYSIQKDYCLDNMSDWSDKKAVASAEEAFDRMFHLKWTPSGRGLWMMGVDFIHERKVSEALLNCAFITTKDIDQKQGDIFRWFMEMLMLGVGVGSDVKGRGKIMIKKPNPNMKKTYIVNDDRESWAMSVGALFESYIENNVPNGGLNLQFDYSRIRPKGEPIKGFGGISSGYEPLKKLHERIKEYLDNNDGLFITTRTLADIFNAIGACVVAGNIRRSAEILFGSEYDDEFYNLKNYDKNPERAEIGWTSNNSIFANIGTYYNKYTDNIIKGGEPGFVWMHNVVNNARMGELKPDNALGFNPCGEIALANKELCNLVEIHINNHDSLYDYLRTLKFAYLYGKTITLTYEWINDNESRNIMMQNRRVGLSNTGIAQFINDYGIAYLKMWFEKGYEFVKHYDMRYSSWFGVPESIRLTTSKPSGTIALLSGSTPGVHYPRSEFYIRRIRLQEDSNLVQVLKEAGLHIEKDQYSDNTMVAEFPIHAGDNIPGVLDLSIWEQMSIAAFVQKYWADNSVSVTVSFDSEKVTSEEIARALDTYQFQLKSVSLLPEPAGGAYAQMPYEEITKEQYIEMRSRINFELFDNLRNNMDNNDRVEDKFCSTDVCEIKFEVKDNT